MALRLITKVKKGKWKIQHSNGEVTYHKTLKAAKAYVHLRLTLNPFEEDKKCLT